MLGSEKTLLGLVEERSKVWLSASAIELEMEFLESRALFQKPKLSISSSALLLQLVDEGLVFGGLIWRERSGCAGKSSILVKEMKPFSSGVWLLWNVYLRFLLTQYEYFFFVLVVCCSFLMFLGL